MRVATPTSCLLLLLGSALLPTGVAQAQQRTMYRCTSDGRVYLSDRPCEGRPATGLAAIGPAREQRSPPSSGDAAVAKAASYLGYLSPICAELNEGLRNGAARGLGSRAMNELRTSYQERCGEDEQEARKRLAEDQRKARDTRERDLAAAKSEDDRRKLSREQCDEMYRIAHGKRQRLAAMTPGERADFERFEANWQARCKVG